ncbi:MAG: DegV family protein [Clostridia bacterium]|nr:DegV family protein [Clostridia bacterium]
MKKRQFSIVTDSGCDMPQAYLKAHGVEKVPLFFTLEGQTYSGDEMTADTFYEKLKGGSMPVTHQATPEQIKEKLTPLLEAGQDVFALAFSSGLSGTANSYVCAAKELQEKYPDRKILVVDSLCASMGQGLLLDYLVNYADKGHTIEQTQAYIEGLKGQIGHAFTVDNLYHLKRGGRVSGVAALIGTMLKIKPVMHVDDNGKLVVLGKCMGRKKALREMVARVEKMQVLDAGDPIFISHGSALTEAEEMQKQLQQKFPKNPVTIGEIGPVIGSHSGAGTIAIFFKAKNR